VSVIRLAPPASGRRAPGAMENGTLRLGHPRSSARMKHTWRACRWAGTASSIEGRLGQVVAVGRFAFRGAAAPSPTDAEAPRQAHVREVPMLCSGSQVRRRALARTGVAEHPGAWASMTERRPATVHGAGLAGAGFGMEPGEQVSAPRIASAAP
jgi:hypothetical protein